MPKDYYKYLEKKAKEWESLCGRCGGCCGAYDDPCLHLVKDRRGKFYCKIYTGRFGRRKSIKNEEFKCVPVKEIFHTRWKKDYLCVYKKLIKR